VTLAGEKPYAEIPSWLAGFDATIMPFKRTPLTEAANPVKAYEILAAGKPLVSVPLPEMELLVRWSGSPRPRRSSTARSETELSQPDPAGESRRRVFAQGTPGSSGLRCWRTPSATCFREDRMNAGDTSQHDEGASATPAAERGLRQMKAGLYARIRKLAKRPAQRMRRTKAPAQAVPVATAEMKLRDEIANLNAALATAEQQRAALQAEKARLRRRWTNRKRSGRSGSRRRKRRT